MGTSEIYAVRFRRASAGTNMHPGVGWGIDAFWPCLRPESTLPISKGLGHVAEHQLSLFVFFLVDYSSQHSHVLFFFSLVKHNRAA